MKIAQMIDNLHLGGAQKMQMILAQAMQERDVELTLISLDTDKADSAFPDQIKQLNVNVHYFPAPKMLDITRLRKIARFLKEGQFDLVHAHLTYANIVGTLAGRMAGIPTIASFRSMKADPNKIRAQLEAFLLRRFTTNLMAVGHATAAAHKERVGAKPIKAIPNAVTLIPPMDAEKRRKLRCELVGDPERPIIIGVGRLVPMKGFDTLIDALANVRQHYPEATLIIAGAGSYKETLESQIKARGLTDHAHLLGFRRDIPQLLAASDIFVNASHWEGLSNAILEAMAAGLPVIATNNSDTPLVVVEGTGILFEAKDTQALTEGLLTFLDTDKRRTVGAAARQHMAEEYNLDRWANQMIELWHSTLAQAHGEQR